MFKEITRKNTPEEERERTYVVKILQWKSTSDEEQRKIISGEELTMEEHMR